MQAPHSMTLAKAMRAGQVWERKPLFCTAVPGESAWVGQLDKRRSDAAALQNGPRQTGESVTSASRG